MSSFTLALTNVVVSDPLLPGQIGLSPAYPDRAAWGTAPSLRAWQTAALVACARRGLAERKARVTVDGGELVIDWDEASGHVFMTGPVEIERTGTLAL